MSTITPTPLMAEPDWIPEPLGRLTLDQYEAMVEFGILTARDRMMLINGCLVEKISHSPPHAVADELCGDAPDPSCRRAGRCGAKPVRIPSPDPEADSEPEPDRAVVRGSTRDYLTTTPRGDRRRFDRRNLQVQPGTRSQDSRHLRRASPPAGSSTRSTARSRSIPSPGRPVTGRWRCSDGTCPDRHHRWCRGGRNPRRGHHATQTALTTSGRSRFGQASAPVGIGHRILSHPEYRPC